MPFSLEFILPINWSSEKGINQISLSNENHTIDIASTDLKLSAKDGQVVAFIDKVKLEAKSNREFILTLTLK